jgi:hypothetical protein
VIADARAVLDIDALRLVDEHADEPALGRRLDVDQLIAHPGQRAFEERVQIHVSVEKRP